MEKGGDGMKKETSSIFRFVCYGVTHNDYLIVEIKILNTQIQGQLCCVRCRANLDKYSLSI